MSREIPHATKQRAVQMYLSGETSKVVAVELNISAGAVLDWVRAAGGEVRPSKSAGHDPVESSPTRLTGGAWVRDGLVYRWTAA
jgi:transposase-like protein